MKTHMVIGGALVALGIVVLLYQGISYKSRDTVLDLGPLHATAERTHTLPLSPIVGIAAVVGGVLVMVFASPRSPLR